MYKVKILISIIVFISLLVCTSVIKNETRDIEKIYDLAKIIDIKEKDFNESQLDFSYLTSPAVIEKNKALRQKSISAYGVFENILVSSFLNLQNKFVTQENKREKKKNKILMKPNKFLF